MTDCEAAVFVIAESQNFEPHQSWHLGPLDRGFDDVPREVQLFDASPVATARIIWLITALGHDGSEALNKPRIK